jgi:hypothetical protein
MWLDNDVLNWFPTLKNFYRSPFSRNCSMSGINSGHHYLPTYKIVMISDNVELLWYILKMWTGRNCSWVDNDVLNWFPTLKNFYQSPFSKWPPQYCKNSTLSEIITIQDIIFYTHIKFWWYRTMLNFCGIVVAILKMATGRNCSMSAINSGNHYLHTKGVKVIFWGVQRGWGLL